MNLDSSAVSAAYDVAFADNSPVTTHRSHFGITDVVEYDRVTHLISPRVSDLFRVALAIGMSRQEELYQIEEITPSGVITNTTKITGYIYKDAAANVGLIGKHNQEGDWYLQIERKVYNVNFARSF